MCLTGALFIFKRAANMTTWINSSNVKAHNGASKDNTCAVRFATCGEFLGTAIYGIDHHSTWCVWRITSADTGLIFFCLFYI
jgi:hypothetical protein